MPEQPPLPPPWEKVQEIASSETLTDKEKKEQIEELLKEVE